MENYFFLKNYVTSEGAVFHSVLYYQQLPITRYQARFHANKYFNVLPIVSTAFKGKSYISTATYEAVIQKYHGWIQWLQLGANH